MGLTFRLLNLAVFCCSVSMKKVNKPSMWECNSCVICFFLLACRLLSIDITSSASRRRTISTISVCTFWRSEKSKLVSWWWSDKEVQLVNQLLQIVLSNVMILDSWENFGKFSLCPLDVKKLQKFRATITQWNTDTSPLQYLITISKEWNQAYASPPLYRCHWGLEAAIPTSVATPFWLSPPPALLMLPWCGMVHLAGSHFPSTKHTN